MELKREYKFRNSGRTYTGVPVMAANMDTTGTFNIAKCFNEHGCFVCIHKHYSLDEWKAFAKECPDVLNNIAVSSGTSDTDFEKIQLILDAIPDVTTICLDIANGYSEHFVAYVRKVESKLGLTTRLTSFK